MSVFNNILSVLKGMAMLVVDIPTGYLMEQPTADGIVRSGIVPEMRDADVLKSGKTIWYFDHIPNVTRCFEHTVSMTLRSTRKKYTVLVPLLAAASIQKKIFFAIRISHKKHIKNAGAVEPVQKWVRKSLMSP